MMAAQAQPQPANVVLLWNQLGAKFAELLRTGAHADMIITVRDGKVQLVRVSQSFLPTDLVPK